MKLSIGKKLQLGFAVVLALMVISAVITYGKINAVSKIETRLLELRVPTVEAGKDLTNGVNASLAGLRGYMILGADPAKAEVMKSARAQGWQLIDDAVARFEQFSVNWTDPANIERLQRIKVEVEAFRVAQQEVEDISHTSANIASYAMLLDEAAPRASGMLTALNAIIDEEEKLEATAERKQLLKNLADTRGSFAVGLANIRAFLLSGKENFRKGFDAKWVVNEARFKQINRSQLLFTASQRKQWQSYSALRAEFAPLPNKMFQLRTAKDWNKANHWLGTKAAPRAREIQSILVDMKESQDQLKQKDVEMLGSEVDALVSVLLIVTALSLVIGIAVALIITRQITSRLNPVVHRAEEISAGDMSGQALQVQGGDELAQLTKAMNGMCAELKQVVEKTAGSIDEVSGDVKNIYETNEQMAQDVKNQLSEITAVSAAIEQMTASAGEVARNSAEASTSASDAAILAKTGGSKMDSLLSSMESVDQSFSEGTQSVESLSQLGNEVEGIVQVIKGIADQTNLLALNAAIEAARAGEQGRGFAVVADEVRQLAQRTTEATKEVNNSVTSIISGTQVALEKMTQGQSQVAIGVEQANDASRSLNSIVSGAQDVEEKIQAIAATAEQQLHVSEDVAQNVDRVANISQQTYDGVCAVVDASNQVHNNADGKSKELLSMLNR